MKYPSRRPRSNELLAGLGAALLALTGLIPLSANAGDDLERVRKEVKSGEAILVDVREPAEWKKGHVAEARLIPTTAFASGTVALDTLPKDKPIYLHCAVGPRARRVATFLKGKGFDARPLSAGYRQLVVSGFTDAK